ncbi:MAG: calcium/proton exchanger [Planctomycetes bacterium]|nr:calcium/proton exchanger [Planctomycetota bacterium]
MTRANSPANGFEVTPLDYLLLAIPVAVVLKLTGVPAVWTFLVSCVAVIPLAGLMGRATEHLAETMGTGIGGLLNATFGNAAELIIALVALSKAGENAEMFNLVKASITGSVVGNILLVLGVSILAGGLKYTKQTFNRTAAGMGATLLALASIGLLLPTLHYRLSGAASDPEQAHRVELLSEEIAAILLCTYVLSLVFSLRTHRHLFAGPEEELPTTGAQRQPEWSRRVSFMVLLVATAGVALMSEFLVGSVEGAAHKLGMSNVFVGVIVVAVIGNAAEHSTAVMVALKDKMDLALNIAVGSSIQIALFVAPVLVFSSMVMGHPHPLDLHFSSMEVVAVVIAVGVLALVGQDGESHWMEGVMLLAVYFMLALSFYHLPAK